MSRCFIVGRKARIESNGHEYICEPFIVFETESGAKGACDMIESVSGERPMIASAALYRRGETAADKD